MSRGIFNTRPVFPPSLIPTVTPAPPVDTDALVIADDYTSPLSPPYDDAIEIGPVVAVDGVEIADDY